MCGIFGLFPNDKLESADAVLRLLAHRGPDDSGWVPVGRGLFGHTRLAILDLSRDGHQPMSDPSQRFTIVFNGEIYNFGELKCELQSDGFLFRSSTDTEVLLQGFAKWGVQLFARLQGMFALAIYDAKTDEVVLARDRLGIKPLVYCIKDSVLVFASELKALDQNDLVSRELDPEALASLMRFGAVAQPNTILQGVRQLPPGHYLIFAANGSSREDGYCSLRDPHTKRWTMTYEETVSRLRTELEAATRRHLLADVEVGCFLSGGIDSTAVLALMQRQVNYPIKAFSLGFSQQNEQVDETDIAERSASAIGAEFHRVTVTEAMVGDHFENYLQALDQPSIDGFNTYLVSNVAAKYVKVVLSGLGGDELFGGYPHYRLISETSVSALPWDHVARWLHDLRPSRLTLKRSLKGRNELDKLRLIRQVFSDKDINQMLRRPIALLHVDEVKSSFSPLQNVSMAECVGYLRDTLLRDSDAVSMWHGLEVRPVLLDQAIVEIALQLPDDFKVRNGCLKAVFVDAVRDLLPQEVLQRKKSGFELPVVRWMNGVLQPQIYQLWKAELATTIFRQEFVNTQLLKTQRRQLERRDWLLLSLLGWLDSRMGAHR
jgi:asparagine synthase (glutamine-hydrolysing)